MRSFTFPLFFALLFGLSPYAIEARTTKFNPTDSNFVYSPQSSWERSGGRNGSIRSVKAGATVEIKFAGEQIILYGSTSSDVSVSVLLDDRDRSSIFETSMSASPARLFRVSDLDGTGDHTLRLAVRNNETLVLNSIHVAFSSASGNVPALLPFDPVSATRSFVSNPSTSSNSPLQSATSSRASEDDGSVKSTSAGLVVGATLGTLAAVSLLVYLVFYLCRRHRRAHSSEPPGSSQNVDDSRYMNQETGAKRGSFLLPAFQNRRASSFLPWNTTPRTPLSPSPIMFSDRDAEMVNGGIGASPRNGTFSPQSPSQSTVVPVVVGSETWQAKLTRAASWKRKAERLAETRKFYGLAGRTNGGGRVDPRGPPPAVPLPRPPGSKGNGDGPREMEERWRVGEPTLNVKGTRDDRHGPKTMAVSPPISISPYLIATPQNSTDGVDIGTANQFEQAYGRAISTPSDDDDLSSIQVASPNSTIHPHQHLRRRSHPSPPGQALPFSPIGEGFAPYASTSSKQSILHYQNPFTHARSITTTTSNSFEESRSSIENARISLAQTRPVRSGGGLGNSLPIGLPLRSSSMRSVNEGTVRAGPKGDTSVGLIAEKEVMVERKPSLTRIVNGKVVGTTNTTVRGRHESVAGIIEGGRKSEESTRMGGRRSETRKRREEPEFPSEEDRPDFWVKRDIIPKYSVEGGDPRRRAKQ
ncbi:hypothetical protein JCM16303_006728 [Sporobolomyces ruberrimus]